MKFLVVGLGNIGAEYEKTRHNIGFMVLDFLAAQQNITFKQDKLAFSSEFTYKSRQIILIKPTTYMNLSGKAVQYHLQHHKIPISNLLIITDELALPFGTIRIKSKGSDGGHNGLKSIQESIQTQEYTRMRMGIGANFPKGKQVDYVLQNFSLEEQAEMEQFLNPASNAILSYVFHGLQNTMTNFNKNWLETK